VLLDELNHCVGNEFIAVLSALHMAAWAPQRPGASDHFDEAACGWRASAGFTRFSIASARAAQEVVRGDVAIAGGGEWHPHLA
jgi:hypothetical protein